MCSGAQVVVFWAAAGEVKAARARARGKRCLKE